MRRTPQWMAVAAVTGLLGLAGCAEEQSPVCASLDAVRTTMDHVRDANVSENGMSQLQADLSQLRVDMQQLRADAQAQFAPQVAAVRSAADGLVASVEAARAAPAAGTLSAVRTSVVTLQTSLQQLDEAASGRC